MAGKISGQPLLCPSAQAEWQGSVVIGVVGGTADDPKVEHFPNALPVTDGLIALAKPVTPGEVFRFAAKCMGNACMHFHGEQCHLATQIVQLLPTVTERLPTCSIRPNCRWWQQEGKEACMRCPQVITENYNPSRVMLEAATPKTASEHQALT